MTDRITNADVPRMLREMSPAARDFANAMATTLFYYEWREPMIKTWATASAFAAHALAMSREELFRAQALNHAVLCLLHERYEIVDRWGK